MIATLRPSLDRIVAACSFGLLTISVAFSVAGLTLLKYAPGAAAQAGPALPWLMRVPTWVYMIALPVLVLALYWRELGPHRSLRFLVWGSAVGLAAELIGTNTGLPFGPYAYTDFLNPKVLGHVPYLIPPSWYAMALVSLDLAGRLATTRWGRIALGSGFMVLWDVALDPAMGVGFPVWRWEVDGFFYGMPLINWVGWFLTSVVILAGFERWGGLPRAARSSMAGPVWAISLALPVGILVLRGFVWAALAGSAALVIPLFMMRWRLVPRGRRLTEPSPQAQGLPQNPPPEHLSV